jgi:myomegalin
MLSFSELTKNSPMLEGDAIDGFFANKHGRHVIDHIDDYSALRQQIGEGKLLVQKILSLIIPACNFPGHKAQYTEVTMITAFL